MAAPAEMGSPYHLRTVEQIAGWSNGLELVDPGVVPVTHWRPDPAEVDRIEPVDGCGGVARKPEPGREPVADVAHRPPPPAQPVGCDARFGSTQPGRTKWHV